MSLTLITSNALSGLNAAQSGMRATSNNISNLNTPGYARQEAVQVARLIGSAAAGVDIAEIRRVTDQFLTAAAGSAQSSESAATALREYLDRAQAGFGDPASESSVFNTMSGVFALFAEAAADPASPVRRSSALGEIGAVLDEFDRLGASLQDLRGQADARIAGAVDQVNDLLEQVVRLNGDVARGRITNDSAGAENARAQVLDQLSELISVRVIEAESGAVEVRTDDGLLLAGHSAAVLSYRAQGLTGPETQFNPITVQYGNQAQQSLAPHLKSGEIFGLLQARDVELPAIADSLGAMSAGFAEAVNAAHNDSTSFPAPSSLTGQNTGLTGADAHGFTGVSHVALVDANGTLVDTIALDFDAGTVTRAGGGGAIAMGATIQTMTTALDTALGGAGGTATFAGGRLTVTGGGNGVAFAQDPASPSDRSGRGFAHAFGMNDLVVSNQPLSFATGLTGTDPHGVPAGQSITVRLVDERGGVIGQSSITPSATGATVGDVVGALNATGTGLGDFGAFQLDAAGSLSFAGSASYPNARVEVVTDTTRRGDTGRSLSQLFGMGAGPGANRATGLSIHANVDSDPRRLALGAIDMSSAVIGQVVTGAGDGAGGQKLQSSGSTALSFDAAGGLPAMTTTILDYAGRMAGDIGRRAEAADRDARTAQTLAAEANARRASVEGVNVDEEMVKLTQFQQAYTASSRLIQAAKEMSDVLLSLV